MIAERRSLTDITVEATRLLYRQMGIVNTIRFIRQFTEGLGNYTEEREELFKDQTLDDLIERIEQRRKNDLQTPHPI